MANLITKIENTRNDQLNSVDIGAEAKNVVVPLVINGTTEYISLEQFVQYLYDYFTNGDFLFYGPDGPQSKNVKLWYDTNQNSNS